MDVCICVFRRTGIGRTGGVLDGCAMAGGMGGYTSSSISKRVKPPYLDCCLSEGGSWGCEESAMVKLGGDAGRSRCRCEAVTDRPYNMARLQRGYNEATAER